MPQCGKASLKVIEQGCSHARGCFVTGVIIEVQGMEVELHQAAMCMGWLHGMIRKSMMAYAFPTLPSIFTL